MLNDRKVLITGALGVLGGAVARQAKSLGAYTIGVDIIETEAAPHLDQYHCLDLLDAKATRACFAELDGISALFNVAGGFAMGESADDLDSPNWDLMMKLNVSTLRHAVAAALPALKATDRSAIVNVGAYGALSGQANMSAYCCSKSAVMRLTESLAEELKREGVNVNAVLPTIIDTPANRQAMPDADFSEWVSPEALAATMCFLASPGAHAINGVLLPVRGLL